MTCLFGLIVPPRVEWLNVDSRPIQAGVLGAGQMGAGIAATLLRAGISTRMLDVNERALESGSTRARQLALGRGKSPAGDIDPDAADRTAALLLASTNADALADCDIVIEAVTENEAIKIETFRRLANVLRDNVIVASNTSTIPITRMASCWVHPNRFAGMHFFHPAQKMALVEVIRGDQTDDHTVSVLVDLARRLGKTPIVVRDCPGFLVTRVLFPYLSQAIELLLEGVPMDDIDAAAVEFGMPAGPIALHDFIGLDTVLAISRVMAEGYPDRMQASPLLAAMVSQGRLGQKSGRGFRKPDRTEARPTADPDFELLLRQFQRRGQTANRSSDPREIIDRLFLSMLLEAIRAIEDGIVDDAADVDTGVTLGLGFPVSRGGLFGWYDSLGAIEVMSRLASHQHRGPMFHPPASVARIQAENGPEFAAS